MIEKGRSGILRRFFRKEWIETGLVVVLLIIFLWVLKVRFAGREGPPPRAAATRTTETEFDPDRLLRVGGKSPELNRTVGDAASPVDKRIQVPSCLTRDPFAPVNPTYDPLRREGSPSDHDPLVLNGVLMDSENPLAVIGKEVVGVGDPVPGGTVVSIRRNEVVLSMRGKERVLKMKQDRVR